MNLGGDYDLGRDWSADVYVSYSKERGESRLPVTTLPGGEVWLAIGAQLRREAFNTRSSAFTSGASPRESAPGEQSRDVSAIFGEARISLVGETNARPGVQRLELFLGGRYEEYGD